MPGLNMGIIKELPVLLPRVQQQRIITNKTAELRESLEHLEALYHQRLAALSELQMSLLDQAFTGRL